MEKSAFEQSVDSYERIVQRARMQVKYASNWSGFPFDKTNDRLHDNFPNINSILIFFFHKL
jgi:hypothetical protein